MIHFATSYFYQIRFFRPDMIPLSTAKFDPKWFHQNKGHNFTFFDKNHVLNGLRFEEFAPGLMCEGLCCGPETCSKNVNNCDFFSAYRRQLEKVSFENLIHRCEDCLAWYKIKHNIEFTEPTFVMMVYETPTNPCSERSAIQDWFKSKGVKCEELHIDKSLKI